MPRQVFQLKLPVSKKPDEFLDKSDGGVLSSYFMELSAVYTELHTIETETCQKGDKSPRVGSHSYLAIKHLRWTTVATVHGKNLNIPESPGVYGYAEVKRVQGLPVEVRWMYIGKARNLRRRISNGHDARYEKNLRLRSWLSRSRGDVELWFAHVDESDLDRIERSLIVDIQPVFNSNLK